MGILVLNYLLLQGLQLPTFLWVRQIELGKYIRKNCINNYCKFFHINSNLQKSYFCNIVLCSYKTVFLLFQSGMLSNFILRQSCHLKVCIIGVYIYFSVSHSWEKNWQDHKNVGMIKVVRVTNYAHRQKGKI